MGSGLAAAERRHGGNSLATLLVRWPFFATVVDDLELTLAKVDMEVAGLYAELAGVELAHYFTRLKDEFVLTRDFVLKLRGEQRLLDGEPTMQRSVTLRNPYLDPMHLMQIDLLRRWREGGSRNRDLFDALVASIGGIAQGLQGTG
jgi:phosphoenolpyruvate carboxylase